MWSLLPPDRDVIMTHTINLPPIPVHRLSTNRSTDQRCTRFHITISPVTFLVMDPRASRQRGVPAMHPIPFSLGARLNVLPSGLRPLDARVPGLQLRPSQSFQLRAPGVGRRVPLGPLPSRRAPAAVDLRRPVAPPARRVFAPRAVVNVTYTIRAPATVVAFAVPARSHGASFTRVVAAAPSPCRVPLRQRPTLRPLRLASTWPPVRYLRPVPYSEQKHWRPPRRQAASHLRQRWPSAARSSS